MRVLMISRHVDPFSPGGNKNILRQVKSLRKDFGVDVEILTWPKDDVWLGPLPPTDVELPPLKIERDELVYNVFTAPNEWNESAGGNVISEKEWNNAVNYGIKLLEYLKPTIVHLQHRHGLWWILESAQKLGLPTVYSNHDWGMVCMRTVLVMGNKSLCDGIISPLKCAKCVVNGRGIIGWANEIVVRSSLGRKMVNKIYYSQLLGNLSDHGIVFNSAIQRANLNHSRATQVLTKLNHFFTPSTFGKNLFTQFGINPERITMLPWPYDPIILKEASKLKGSFTITYIGRVSPDKGVDLIFKAMESLEDLDPIVLRICGANDFAYCRSLKSKYPKKVGRHVVEWFSWIEVEPLYNSTDISIIPSLWMDNTPLTLIEALAYKVPMVATRIPTIEEFVTDNKNSFLAEYRSIQSLADAIRRAYNKKVEIREGDIQFPQVNSSIEYMSKVMEVYKTIINSKENSL